VAPVSLDPHVPPSHRTLLDQELMEAFQSELSMDVRPLKQVGVSAPRSPSPTVGKSHTSSLGNTALGFSDSPTRILEDARDGKGDAVLLTTIHKFQERLGSAAAAEHPAQVAFSMRLVRTADNQELWSAVYSFADEAVTDNLLTLERKWRGQSGLGWRKAREVAQVGFQTAARELGDRRQLEFVRK
jgi:hypothetical protein